MHSGDGEDLVGDSGGLGLAGGEADVAEEDGRGLADAAVRGFTHMTDVADQVSGQSFRYHNRRTCGY